MNEQKLLLDHFERHWMGEYNLTDYDVEKVKLINGFIPSDVKTILDVGCGNGFVTNSLANLFRVFATEFSREGLKSVFTPKVQAKLPELPFNEPSVDLVLCCDVLEHLPTNIFEGSVLTLRRLTKKYILITVPYMQTLSSARCKCRTCGFVWNWDTHVRSFNDHLIRRVGTLLKAKLISKQEFGPLVFKWYSWRYWINQVILNKYQVSPVDDYCPSCNSPLGDKKNRGDTTISTIDQNSITHKKILDRFGIGKNWPFHHRYGIFLLFEVDIE